MSRSRTSLDGPERGLLVVMTGPSGCGKSTLFKRVMDSEPNLALSVSHTTRAARPGEVDGQDYYFVTDDTFDTMVAESAFAEWAHVHTGRYGTSRGEVERLQALGRDIVLDIDVQGAELLCKAYPDVVSVFILPPTMQTLESRLRGRGTENENQLGVRLSNAKQEIAHSAEFDYIVVNRDLDAAVAEFRAIVMAERRRGARVRHVTQRLLVEQ